MAVCVFLQLSLSLSSKDYSGSIMTRSGCWSNGVRTDTSHRPGGGPMKSHIQVTDLRLPVNYSVSVVRVGLSSAGTIGFVEHHIDSWVVPFVRVVCVSPVSRSFNRIPTLRHV